MDADLQRMLQPKVNIYNTQTETFGKITEVDDEIVVVNYGGGAKNQSLVEYDLDEFKSMLESDVIVNKSRTKFSGTSDRVVVSPRVVEAPAIKPEITITQHVEQPVVQVQNVPNVFPMQVDIKREEVEHDYSVGYLNEEKGLFSSVPRQGYSKIKYRKVLERVTLDLTSDQIEKLKELGIM